MERLKIVIGIFHQSPTWTIPDYWVEEIRKRCLQAEVIPVKSREELEREIEDADIYFGWALPGEVLRRAKKLRWIHASAAGIRRHLIPELVNSEIIFTNSRGVFSEPIAEYVIGAMIFFSRSFNLAHRFQLERKWAQIEIVSEGGLFELRGKTLGVVGYGSIGKKVAEKGKCLGMKVIAIKRHLTEETSEEGTTLLPKEKLPTLLSESDFVVLTLPLTPETRGLIGEEELNKMKKTAYLINVARGKIVDHDALVKALSNGRIAGAALDVFPEEPLPKESPLFTLKNVLITPHISGISSNYWERVVTLFSENFRRFVKGEPLLNIVDKKLGY
ncbi:MAG: D-2-hydroxyacid dehydrogenase [Acidobacteria bacterium]|nr:D-2-hydroxyacid dehydrogenase [Acidobacteriota bacterium]